MDTWRTERLRDSSRIIMNFKSPVFTFDSFLYSSGKRIISATSSFHLRPLLAHKKIQPARSQSAREEISARCTVKLTPSVSFLLLFRSCGLTRLIVGLEEPLNASRDRGTLASIFTIRIYNPAISSAPTYVRVRIHAGGWRRVCAGECRDSNRPGTEFRWP